MQPLFVVGKPEKVLGLHQGAEVTGLPGVQLQIAGDSRDGEPEEDYVALKESECSLCFWMQVPLVAGWQFQS